MKYLLFGIFGIMAMASCVPAKKYNELLEKERLCSEELAKFKTNALDFEASSAEYQEKYEKLNEDVKKLKADTTKLGQKYRTLRAKYDQVVAVNEALETNYGKLRLTGAQETAQLTANLEAKKVELQQREDELLALESELRDKEKMLNEREQRVRELEEMIRAQEEQTKVLKTKVANALKGFENKGLKVEERDGKIYVSMEAKLLFASGSTTVEPEGKTAIEELSKVLETEKELEIIVEGHTDTDPMKGSAHPKNNWELSVLRSTAVIEIMTSGSQIDPKQLMAAGRSEFHPVDAGDKAKNRRIEIIISPNLNELYELISNE